MLAKASLACLILLLPGSVFAQTAAPVSSPPAAKPNPPKPAPPKPVMAAWSESAESGLGISKSLFAAMGLSKLTNDEYLALVGWAIDREAQAMDRQTKAVTEAANTARAQTLTYSCGRDVKQADGYDKVNVYLSISDNTPSELASRIRQDFRAIKDVQVVFSEEESDLIIGIIGLDLKVTNNQQFGYQTGYGASVTITKPCSSRFGTNQSQFEQFQTNYLMTNGTNPAALADDISTSADAKEIESQRQTNAMFKKFMQSN